MPVAGVEQDQGRKDKAEECGKAVWGTGQETGKEEIMIDKQSMTAGAIFDYVDRLETENRELKEQHAHMIDASTFKDTPVSFMEAARILDITINTLEGYVRQGLIKRMQCSDPKVGKRDRQISLHDILTIRGGKKTLRKLSREVTTGMKYGRSSE